MKIKDVAHNHSLTDLLKVSIFSLLMLAPMINVGVRSAYVICNKNAYQSYYGETINETNEKEINSSDLEINNNYSLYIPLQSTFTGSFVLRFNGNVTINGTEYSNYERIETFISNSRPYFGIYGTSQNTVYIYLDNSAINMNFNYNSLTINGSTMDYQFYVTEYNKYSYLDNVFEYSVNQLTESPLYNWVENTAIYSGVALMNTQLGITQPVISLLLVYWLLLTIIYIIIDIIIRVFTWLTHMIGSKTA